MPQYRYQKIHTQIWHDEDFKKLSEDGRALFLYLNTSPHSNMLGAFVCPRSYICEDLGWSNQKLAKPFAELLGKQLGKQFIYFDERLNLVIIRKHLKHNPLENPNQVKAALKVLAQLPKSPMLSILLEQLGKPYHKPLREQLPKGLGKPEEEPEEVTEEEPENESAWKMPLEVFKDLKEEEVLKLTMTWHGYVDMRKKIKAPMTNLAMTFAYNKLLKLKEEGHDPIEVLEESILNSWKGLFPLKGNQGQGEGTKEKAAKIK